jgi:hypothetical protein
MIIYFLGDIIHMYFLFIGTSQQFKTEKFVVIQYHVKKKKILVSGLRGKLEKKLLFSPLT